MVFVSPSINAPLQPRLNERPVPDMPSRPWHVVFHMRSTRHSNTRPLDSAYQPTSPFSSNVNSMVVTTAPPPPIATIGHSISSMVAFPYTAHQTRRLARFVFPYALYMCSLLSETPPRPMPTSTGSVLAGCMLYFATS